MDIYKARDSKKLSMKKKLELYKNANVLGEMKKTKTGYTLKLSFDEADYTGKGKTLNLAMRNAESLWRKATKNSKLMDSSNFFYF